MKIRRRVTNHSLELLTDLESYCALRLPFLS